MQIISTISRIAITMLACICGFLSMVLWRETATNIEEPPRGIMVYYAMMITVCIVAIFGIWAS